MYLAHLTRRAGRELGTVGRAATPTHSLLRDRLVAIAVATVGIDLICAVLTYAFEHSAPGTQIKTFGSALCWTSSQLLTVSSQLPNPLTVPGRILDVFMEAYAITVVASLAASIGAFMVKRGREIEQAAEAAADDQPSP